MFYYGFAVFQAVAILALLYALLSQPYEHGRLVTAEARVRAQSTEIALLQPTPRPCRVPTYPIC